LEFKFHQNYFELKKFAAILMFFQKNEKQHFQFLAQKNSVLFVPFFLK